MSDELKPEPQADFAADFREGEAMALEWIAGKGGLPDLLHVVRDMPRGGEMGGLEAGFLSTIDAAVRGDRLVAANVQDPATRAQQLLEATPSAEAPPAPAFDVDAFRRRRREHELAAKLEELGRRNEALFVEQQRPFMAGNYLPNDANWRG
jgi:hypothetical protein